MKSRTAWLGHRAGQCVHGAASLAGSQILLPFPSSPFSHFPFTLSCLSLYPFLNCCLHCALKMQHTE